ncbi:MAG: hypothetical protein OEU25_23595, partial [Rhodospirillales bacterium]|nr:hypothetical protein [Rhodospirillales bacterium]
DRFGLPVAVCPVNQSSMAVPILLDASTGAAVRHAVHGRDSGSLPGRANAALMLRTQSRPRA